MRLDDLRDDPENPMVHDNAEIQRLVGVIGELGFIQPIAVDATTMQIIAGHGRVEAAKLCHLTEVPALLIDDYDETQRRLALTATNGHFGHFDDSLLTALLKTLNDDGADLDFTGLEPFRIEELLGEPPFQGQTDPDDVPEPPAEAITQRGDLILMGGHRLLCGDSTNAADVARLMDGRQADLMWTDPPYGVSYVGKTEDSLRIQNDDAAGLEELLAGAFACADWALKPGAAFYIARPAGVLSLTFGNVIVAAGWRLHEELIWVKDSMVLGHSDYHYKHETILYGYLRTEGRRGRGGDGWYGDNSQVSVFEVDRPKASPDHPTGKPVDLIKAHLRNSSRRGDVVYEPFCGSGSTIIAAEQVGITAYACEIDPTYCDVIVARYEAFTGKTAQRPARIPAEVTG